MTNRSADATIKGYHYQFDKTILEILCLSNNNDSVVVEGIEDIDVYTLGTTTAIQCKYYAAQQYSTSTIREAVILMLDDFLIRKLNAKRLIKYHLYIYCQNSDKIPDPFTLDNLKPLLTWKQRNPIVTIDYRVSKNISDKQLSEFLGYFRISSGESFENQHDLIIKEIKKCFNCDDIQAELYYYNNALTKIISTASEKGDVKRRIMKGQFLQDINKKEILFNAWFLQYKGHDKYIHLLKTSVRNCCSLKPTKAKAIFWDATQLPITAQKINIVGLIKNITEEYYCYGKKHHLNDPWTIYIKTDGDQLQETKKALLRTGINFNDGMEWLEFNEKYFNQSPVVEIHAQSEKLKRASFQIRILTAETLKNNMKLIRVPDVLFYISKEDPTIYFDLAQIREFHHFVYITNIEDISTLLC